MTTRPSPHGSTVMSAPASASISSVWVRVVTGLADDGGSPRPTGRPAGWPTSPARWPPSTSSRCRAARRPRPAAAAGSVRPVRSTAAPISASGSATRSIGRSESDSSPTSSVAQAKPATRPHSSRMEVPELPQSSGRAGRCRRVRPPCSTSGAVVGALDLDAHGLDRGERGGDVGAVGEPVHDRGALGQRGEQHGPVRDRLLPRRAHACRGRARRRRRPGCARRRHDRCSARQR